MSPRGCLALALSLLLAAPAGAARPAAAAPRAARGVPAAAAPRAIAPVALPAPMSSALAAADLVPALAAAPSPAAAPASVLAIPVIAVPALAAPIAAASRAVDPLGEDHARRARLDAFWENAESQLRSDLGPAPKEPYRAPLRLSAPHALARLAKGVVRSAATAANANPITLSWRVGQAVQAARRSGWAWRVPMAEYPGEPSPRDQRLTDALLARAGRTDARVETDILDLFGERNAALLTYPDKYQIKLGPKLAEAPFPARAAIIAHELAHLALDRGRGAGSRLPAWLETAGLVAGLAAAAAFWQPAIADLRAGDGFAMIAMGLVSAASAVLGQLLDKGADRLELLRSRRAELRADDYAAWLTRPAWMASAIPQLSGEGVSADPGGRTHPTHAERVFSLRRR